MRRSLAKFLTATMVSVATAVLVTGGALADSRQPEPIPSQKRYSGSLPSWFPLKLRSQVTRKRRSGASRKPADRSASAAEVPRPRPKPESSTAPAGGAVEKDGPAPPREVAAGAPASAAGERTAGSEAPESDASAGVAAQESTAAARKAAPVPVPAPPPDAARPDTAAQRRAPDAANRAAAARSPSEAEAAAVPIPVPAPLRPSRPAAPAAAAVQSAATQPVEDQVTIGEGMAARQCLAELTAAGGVATLADPVSGTKGCRIETPVQLELVRSGDHVIDLRGTPVFACKFAIALSKWLTGVVDPAAQHHLKTRISQVVGGPGYVCRRRNGAASGKLSEHAYGNAFDILGFKFADARRKLIIDEPKAAGEMRAFLEAVRTSACGYFTTVLGPGSDEAHNDHYHVDLRRRGDASKRPTYRVCQ